MSAPSSRIVILPSALAQARARERLLDRADGRVLFGESLFTFERLFHRLAQDLDPGGLTLSPLGREMIAAEILSDDRFHVFWLESQAGPGLRRRLLDLVDHLKELGLSPESLIQAVGRARAEQAFRKVAAFYQAYEAVLKEKNLADRAGQRAGVLAALGQGRKPPALADVGEILVRDFAFLTPYQTALVQALSVVVDRVEVRLDAPPKLFTPQAPQGEGPFEEISKLVQECSKVAGTSGRLVFSSGLAGKASPAPLTFALEHLFGSVPPDDPAPDPTTTIDILAAPGRYHEVETIGRRIVGLLDQGLPSERIAVAFPDLSLYGQMVEDVFRRFHLPLFFRRGAPLAIQGPVRALLALMNLASSHWEQAQVLDILASPYLDTGLELNAAEVRRLGQEAGVTDERAGGGWQENLERLARNKPQEAEAARKLAAGLDRLRRLLAPLARPQTWSGFRRTANEILKTLRLEEKVLAGYPGFVERDVPALEGLWAALQELEQAAQAAGLADRRLSPEELSRGLRQALEDHNVGERSQAGSGIMVLKIYDLHGLDVDMLFLGGLNEGEFPGQVADGALVSDNDCRALNQAVGRSVLGTTAAAYRREELLFYHCLSLTKTRLVLSYTRLDEEGRIMVPSPLVDELLRLWPEGAIPEHRPEPRPLPPLDEALSREELIGGLSLALLAGPPPEDPFAVEVLASLLARPEEAKRWQALVERARREQTRLIVGVELESGPVWGNSLAPWLAQLPVHDGAPLLAATFLEDYGACPFAFWAKAVLGLEGPAELRDEISPSDEGTLFHNVLAKFYGRLRDENRLPLCGDPTEAETLADMAEEVFNRAEARLAVGRRPLWRVKREAARRLLSRWLAQEQKRGETFLPIRFEWSFGPDKAAPPYLASFLGGGRLWFKGRVDQIDEDADHDVLRVIDYKLSAGVDRYRPLLKPEAAGRTSFQAPLYQLAVAEALDRPCQATFYLLRNLDRLKPLPLTSDEVFSANPETRRTLAEENRPNFFNQVEETWTKLTEGRFPATPEREDSCRYCAFELACRAATIEDAT